MSKNIYPKTIGIMFQKKIQSYLEGKQYAKDNGHKHYTIVLNDKCNTNIIY